MGIIQTVCSTGPMKTRPCLALFGVEAQYYAGMAVIAFAAGFGGYYLVKKLVSKGPYRKMDMLISVAISLTLLLIFSAYAIYTSSRAIF
jgi:hypothetical protein